MIIEKLDYIAPSGETLALHNPPSRVVTEMTGWGEPPKQPDTVKGVYQHGETLLAVWLQPREVSFAFRYQATDRNDYWAMRARLNNVLRLSQSDPLFPVPGTLRRTLSNGEIRCLNVILTSGLEYTPSSGGNWDEWSIYEILRFTAHDPIIYDPAPRSIVPLTGFDSQATKSRTINYVGSWASYPTLIMTGPTTGFTITNTTMEYAIKYTGTVAAGEVITLDLRYGKKTVESSVSGSVVGYVDIPNSTLGTWALAPAPLAANGVNNIQVQTSGASSATKFELNFFNNYESI